MRPSGFDFPFNRIRIFTTAVLSSPNSAAIFSSVAPSPWNGALNIEPQYERISEELTEEEAVAKYIIGAEKRRHSNRGQLAILAMEYEKYFADKAKERQRKSGEQFGRGQDEKVSLPVEKPIHAAVEAAKAVGAAASTVHQAKAVQRDAANGTRCPRRTISR